MESILFLHPLLALLVCTALLKPGHIHVFKREFNSDILTRYVSLGKLNNRLDVARKNDITDTYLIPVRPMPDRNISTVLRTWAFAHAGTYRQTGIYLSKESSVILLLNACQNNKRNDEPCNQNGQTRRYNCIFFAK